MALSAQQEEAAILVAEDRLTESQICERVGVKSRKTLWSWGQKAEFTARVDALRDDFRAAVRKRGIAIVERRVDAAARRHRLMERLIDARADAYKDKDTEAPGASTGLLVPIVKLIKVYDAGEIRLKARDDGEQPKTDGNDWSIEAILAKGTIPGDDDLEMVNHDGDVLFSAKRNVAVVEWTLDAKLLAELRAHEKQVAQDLGQWAADETTLDLGPGQVTITAIRYHEPAPASANAS